MSAFEATDILDLQCVADAARYQLTEMLAEVDGPKDVVIQPELMSLLNHVTPFPVLKKYVYSDVIHHGLHVQYNDILNEVYDDTVHFIVVD